MTNKPNPSKRITRSARRNAQREGGRNFEGEGPGSMEENRLTKGGEEETRGHSDRSGSRSEDRGHSEAEDE